LRLRVGEPAVVPLRGVLDPGQPLAGRGGAERCGAHIEEALAAAHPSVFLVRPGFIRPCRGARPATRAQRAVYAVLTPFYPLLKRLFPQQVTTTDAIGQAMLQILHAPQTVPHALDNTGINEVAALRRARKRTET
jgi:hypothetical protein